MIKMTSLIALTVFGFSAVAETSYVDILKSLTQDRKNVVSEVPELSSLLQVQSVSQAQSVLKNKLLENTIARESAPALLAKNLIFDLAKKRQITFVVVPGVLGEFIDTRAFEEVFARKSSYQKAWTALSDRADIKDTRFNLKANAQQEEKLSDLINAASVDDENGKPLFKIIILKTFLGSMESIGNNAEKARIFNRRIQKYYDLTRDQNIVLLGYSRGTPLALEMVVQAEAQRLSYLSAVKSVVSYAGVVMGSSLADVTDDPDTESGKLLKAARKLHGELRMSDNAWDRFVNYHLNLLSVENFIETIAANTPFNVDTFLNNARSGDFKTVAALIAQTSAELNPQDIMDFNGRVIKLKLFITEVLNAVEGLKSKTLQNWWRVNKLPRQLQYYSIAASMVDPKKNEIEKIMFATGAGYSNSLDDTSLLENKRAYEKFSGVAMNDSQVGLHQTLFLPNVIAALNPQNAGLDMKSLGVLQTHHWGMALQVVNKMNDGRMNTFPREKALLALAAYLNQ